jgi:hypothetical protein
VTFDYLKIKSNNLQFNSLTVVSRGNGPVCQVETSPEILLIYRAHIVMIVHKILAVDTRHKGVKKLPKIGTNSSDLCTCMTAACLVVALHSPVHYNGVCRPNADKAVKT